MKQVLAEDKHTMLARGEFDKTPGEMLRQARENQKMDIAFAATELRLTVNYVRALEDDHYESLPAVPFVIGYLKSYAKLLSINPEELIAVYRSFTATDDQITPVKEVERVNLNSLFGPHDLKLFLQRHRKSLLAGVVTILLLVFGYLIFSGSDSTLSTDSEARPQPSGSVISEQVHSDTSENLTDKKISVAITDADADADAKKKLVVSEPFDVNSETLINGTGKILENEPEIDQIPPATDTLSIHFTDDCWLEVVDSDAKVLAKDLYKRGDRISLQGQSPFSVLFGNARVVNVSINGNDINVDPGTSQKRLHVTIDDSQYQ